MNFPASLRFILILLSITPLFGCSVLRDLANDKQSQQPPFDQEAFLSQLLQNNVSAEAVGEVDQPYFKVTGQLLKIDSENIQVFDFRNQSEVDEAVASVSADGRSIGTSTIEWVGTPHFYKRGTLIVIYVGDNYELTLLLESILGPQFAGGTTPPEI